MEGIHDTCCFRYCSLSNTGIAGKPIHGHNLNAIPEAVVTLV